LLRESLAREVDHGIEAAFSFDGARCDRIVAATMARIAIAAPGEPPAST
jgi:RNA polymerase sigma-70 factor (ECF subfamily)